MSSQEKILEKCKHDEDISGADGRYYLLDSNVLPIIRALLEDRERLREALESLVSPIVVQRNEALSQSAAVDEGIINGVSE